jgi:hypothetical protein
MKYLFFTFLIMMLAVAGACGQSPEPKAVASDGIQVHGHWTVTVTNPDGTLDGVHEFDNELMEWTSLTGLLTGQNNVDGWTINVRPSFVNATDFSCKEAIGKYTTGSNILEAAVTVTNMPYLPFSLSAACTVTGTGDDQTGEFATVYTYFYDYDGCALTFDDDKPESGPTTCTLVAPVFEKNSSYAGSADLVKLVTGFGGLTVHSLNPKVQVSEGQVVGVNVDISFS